jgi:FAD/FMN-containing dehydrogenase
LRLLRRNDPGYDEARRDCVWNARIADRFPGVIAQAESEDDVVRAVELARVEEMKIGVRSGGHS